MSKLQISLVGLLIVGIILGNFWFYIRYFSWTEAQPKQIIPEKQTVSTPIDETPSVSKNKKNIQKKPVTAESKENESSKSGEVSSYSVLEKILVGNLWKENGAKYNYSNFWGNENVSFAWDSIKVLYPKGSNAPSNNPRGGLWFICSTPSSYDRLSLSYSVQFDENFDFVKWGKLPGLCGWNCSRSESMPTSLGFSLRFVWKKDGYLDIMSYLPDGSKLGSYTESKMFQFEPQKKYTITQQIQLNDIGMENGVLNILVDGKSVYKKDSMVFRSSSDVQINSLLFSTFFWWSDASYSSTKDEHVLFSNFQLEEKF